MKSVWIILFLIAGGLSQDERSVNVYQVEKEDVLELHAKNTNIYPVTIELNLITEGLKTSTNLPYTGVIPSHTEQKILDFSYTDKQAGWNIQSNYRYYMGNIFARHNDSFAYRLPFPKGDQYRVSQGFGGEFSHQGELQHALDFSMPDGTEIYAARSGKVVMLEEGNTKGGSSIDMMKYANFITIMHDDGTFADYSHLRHQGVEVRLGQSVRIGQLIGYSGATGYATGPHLHFVVKKAKRRGGYVSIPVKFATKDGIIELSKDGDYIGY